MTVYSFIIAEPGLSTSKTRGEYLFQMFRRYQEQHKCKPCLTISEFVFTDLVAYAFKIGDVVSVEGKIGIVRGYSSNDQGVMVERGGETSEVTPVLVKKTDIPPDILEIAKAQLASSCPLKEPGCGKEES